MPPLHSLFQRVYSFPPRAAIFVNFHIVTSHLPNELPLSYNLHEPPSKCFDDGEGNNEHLFGVWRWSLGWVEVLRKVVVKVPQEGCRCIVVMIPFSPPFFLFVVAFRLLSPPIALHLHHTLDVQRLQFLGKLLGSYCGAHVQFCSSNAYCVE